MSKLKVPYFKESRYGIKTIEFTGIFTPSQPFETIQLLKILTIIARIYISTFLQLEDISNIVLVMPAWRKQSYLGIRTTMFIFYMYDAINVHKI